MFDFGLSELLLTGVIALIVLGPERLPKAARMAGNLVGKLQRLVSSVKQELSVQAELDELRQAKQEFEQAAQAFQTQLKDTGDGLNSSLGEISDGLKPWERLPEQRTPADFGIDAAADTADTIDTAAAETPEVPTDENGQPIAPPAAADDGGQAWKQYLLGGGSRNVQEVSYAEIPSTAAVSSGLHTPSLRQQALRRKRDARPRFRPQPKLRVRKK
ncbi:Sec-independent protein translocase protein TatB [Neisseria lisongii]|uniref:Sec-independent protein translocase protein TatB n=1 Tax=Neisseria lisongii TaxID=2912188 RepID=A0AAW5AP66_9NEIS|nr:Sec-independent protein translocase protein TatB [Neisseria lisongii]MCF7529728.1 Sec-independent protein translocase protein TatB [Neisseria lisongii]